MSPRPPFPPPPRKSGKHRLVIGIMLAVVLLSGVISFLTSSAKPARKAAPRQEIITITLPPPLSPPPPPKVEPPPPVDEPKEQEMVEQEPVADDEPPPEDSPPDVPPAEDLSTGIAGNGPDMGLSRGGNGGTGKIGGSGRKGGGSKFGWYAAKVQTAIAEALRRNSATKNASMTLQVRVWPGSNGRITRAQLVGSSGSSAVDQAIRNQVLTGLQLSQAPPADMPIPIVLRITARKSGI
ncbi:MAG: TonB C-terminal domain-containing protein [Verrucomicrobiota bacterium]